MASVAAGTPMVATVDLGNSSSVRKRISVLVHEHDFSDLHVCTFWLEPSTPRQTYTMRTAHDHGVVVSDNLSLRRERRQRRRVLRD